MGYPMLDPERDLKGATPEKLARALLRPIRRPLADRVREQEGQYAATEGTGAGTENRDVPDRRQLGVRAGDDDP